MSTFLTRVIGFPATLLNGDSFVLDRWMWVKRHLPRTCNDDTLLDVGCGSGGFTIGASLRGYRCTGISWDERNQRVASERAALIGAKNLSFDIVDVRHLNDNRDYRNKFDIVICLECIEHILDDTKLMRDMADCLRPGGRLLLTTPFLYCPPITRACYGPFAKTEDGRHVRRGYTRAMLNELCGQAGLIPESIDFCSGRMSQIVTRVFRTFSKFNKYIAWALVLPLRILPPVIDPILDRIFRPTNSSICLEAYKPRFPS